MVVDLEDSTVEHDVFEMFFPDRACLQVSVGLKNLPLQSAGHTYIQEGGVRPHKGELENKHGKSGKLH